MGIRKCSKLWRRYLDLLIDNDCGVDDAGAIMMALADARSEIMGLSTVNGNVSLQQVNSNVLRLLAYLGYENVPVYSGAHRPLIESPRSASMVHGTNGFGGVTLPEAGKTAESLRAPEGLYTLAREYSGCTVAALGPLTNLAITLALYPDFKDHVSRMVIMGGAIDRGNVTRYAEFNIAADPEAAEIVFNAGIPITMLPWDVCLTNIFSEEEVLSFGLGESRAGRLFLDINTAPFDYFEKITGRRAIAMADEIAMACCLNPGIITQSITSDIHVELAANLMRGATVTCAGSAVRIVTEIDREGCIEALLKIKELS